MNTPINRPTEPPNGPRCTILFPAFSDALREPDPEFFRGWQFLEAEGWAWRVVEVEAVFAGDLGRALRFVPPAEPRGAPIRYRGWILKAGEYRALYRGLRELGYRPLTTPEQYDAATYLPLAFPGTADLSVPAAWVDGPDPGAAWAAAQRLGPPPYFIKDHVKSAKEIYPRGCLVGAGEDRGAMKRAVAELRDYRGDRFDGGIVIRPLLDLRPVGHCPFAQRPIYEEYRLFFLDGEVISRSWYDREGGGLTDFSPFADLPGRLGSPFFSADVVVTSSGQALLLETGDGGCSALPPKADLEGFYRALVNAV